MSLWAQYFEWVTQNVTRFSIFSITECKRGNDCNPHKVNMHVATFRTNTKSFLINRRE